MSFEGYLEFASSYAKFFIAALYEEVNQAATAPAWTSAVDAHVEQQRIKCQQQQYKQQFHTNATHPQANQQQQQDERCAKTDAVPRIGSRYIEEDGVEVAVGSFNSLRALDYACIVFVLINMTFIKRCIAHKLKHSRRLQQMGLRARDRRRMVECVWRLMFYACSSLWLIYTCFIKSESHGSLLNSRRLFTEYSFRVHFDEYLICMIELGFYLHATYALVFEDVWRRDSSMMFVHHLAAIFSVLALYATRTHRIGLVAIALRDICDVLLEVTKLGMCLRVQHGRSTKYWERWVKLSFCIFTFSFVINQLYFYPLFCMYHGLVAVKTYNLNTPAVRGILFCGIIFLVLDIAWFMLIMRLFYRLIFSDTPFKDLREYDDDEDVDEYEDEEEDTSGSERERRKRVARKRTHNAEVVRRRAPMDQYEQRVHDD